MACSVATRSVATRISVSRRDIFQVLKTLLLHGCHLLFKCHEKGPWMQLLVHAVQRLSEVFRMR